MAGVDDYLTCAVCLDWFKSPRRLPCSHVYCLECLQGLVRTGTDSITCPECRGEHVMTNGKVDGFPLDGRLKQFMEEQKYGLCGSSLSTLNECDDCQLPTCLACETKHRAQLLESLLQNVRQLETDFYTEHQMMVRKKEKTRLLQYKITLNSLRMKVDIGIEDMIKELKSRRVTLMSRIDEEENFLKVNLSNLDLAENIKPQHQAMRKELVYKAPTTKTLVSMTEEIEKQKQLLTSLQNVKHNDFKRIEFNELNLKEAITSYGDLITTPLDCRPQYTLLTTLDGSEYGDEVFNEPWGLTVCPFTDNVYVTDWTSIRVYSSNGEYIRHLDTNDARCCVGLAIDGNQRVIVTYDTENNVKIFNNDLQLIKRFGSGGDRNGQFNEPLGVACDVDNNIYVADRNNKRIQVFTSDGTFLSVIGHGVLEAPFCVQINQRQELLVTDNEKGHVVIFSRLGQHLRNLPEGFGNDPLFGPIGICLDGKGHVLVADSSIKAYNDDGTHYCTITEPAVVMKDMYGLAVTSELFSSLIAAAINST